MTEKFEMTTSIMKVDYSLGLVFGWAIVCKEFGEPYFDLHNDHIPEEAMLKAATDFMEKSQVAKEMHAGDAIGQILFAFPMTKDIADAFGLHTNRTGLIVAMKPASDPVLEKFRSGEYTGFSIGGQRIEDELLED
jgi:hypothetical protein